MPVFQTNYDEEWDGKTGQLVKRVQKEVDVTKEVVELTLHEQLDVALAQLRTVANGTGTMTTAQLSNALRVNAGVLIKLTRLVIKRLDDTT